MRYNIFIIILIHSFIWSQPNMQPKKVTEKFFPEYEELKEVTPGLQKKRGYTNYDELISFLEYYSKIFPKNFSLEYIGKSQKGYKIPIVNLFSKNSNSKVKVWFQAGLHGNESASTEGMLYLIYDLLNNSPETLDYLDISIVPMANIDGYLKISRYASNGLDLNRDNTKLMAPETIALKKAFNKFSPELAVDFHEYTPFRRDYAKFGKVGISSLFDVMFLISGNLNIPKNLRNYSNGIFLKNAQDAMDQNGYSYRPYVSTTKINNEIHFNQSGFSSRSNATSFALTNCVSALIEVRGVRIGKDTFKRRTRITYLIAMSYLSSAIEEKETIKEQIKIALKDPKDIVVKSERNVYKDTIQTIDLYSNSIIDLSVTIRDALNPVPTLKRKSPKAYVIMSSEKEIIDKLPALGIIFNSIEKSRDFIVEKYSVTDYKKSNEKIEKLITQDVSTTISIDTINFPAGSIVVPTNQKNVNLIYEILEPEAPNSFVSWGLIKANLNSTLPIYRIPNNLDNEK